MGTLTVVKLTLLVIFLQDVDSCPEVRGRIIKTEMFSMFPCEAAWLLLVSEGGDGPRLQGVRAGGQLGGGEAELQAPGHVVGAELPGGDDEPPRVRAIWQAELTCPPQLSASPRQIGQPSNR